MEKARKVTGGGDRKESQFERVIGKAQKIKDRLKKEQGVELLPFLRQIVMENPSSKLEMAKKVLIVYQGVEKMVRSGKLDTKPPRKGKH